jgi:hypothetical protein
VHDSWTNFSCLEQLSVDVATGKACEPFRAVKHLVSTCNLILDLGIERERSPNFDHVDNEQTPATVSHDIGRPRNGVYI